MLILGLSLNQIKISYVQKTPMYIITCILSLFVRKINECDLSLSYPPFKREVVTMRCVRTCSWLTKSTRFLRNALKAKRSSVNFPLNTVNTEYRIQNVVKKSQGII